MMLEKIRFGDGLSEDIFSDIASEAADYIGRAKKENQNKTNQLRKFYDELVMWNEKVQREPEDQRQQKYEELAPFIKMLNAKVAYAAGRDHVDRNFENLFSHCIKQIKDYKTLRHCKLFIEALIGSRKSKE